MNNKREFNSESDSSLINKDYINRNIEAPMGKNNISFDDLVDKNNVSLNGIIDSNEINDDFSEEDKNKIEDAIDFVFDNIFEEDEEIEEAEVTSPMVEVKEDVLPKQDVITSSESNDIINENKNTVLKSIENNNVSVLENNTSNTLDTSIEGVNEPIPVVVNDSVVVPVEDTVVLSSENNNVNTGNVIIDNNSNVENNVIDNNSLNVVDNSVNQGNVNVVDNSVNNMVPVDSVNTTTSVVQSVMPDKVLLEGNQTFSNTYVNNNAMNYGISNNNQAFNNNQMVNNNQSMNYAQVLNNSQMMGNGQVIGQNQFMYNNAYQDVNSIIANAIYYDINTNCFIDANGNQYYNQNVSNLNMVNSYVANNVANANGVSDYDNSYKVKIVKKKPGILHFIVNIISYTIFILLLILGLVLLGYVLDNKIREVKGDRSPAKYNAYVVLTGSMIPTIDINDVVITKYVEPSKLEKDDIITFWSDHYELNVTHRILESYYDDVKGEYTFKTKGDNNEYDDPTLVSGDRIYGEVIFRIPKLGYIQNFLAQDGGWIIVVLVPCLIVLSYDIMKLFKMAGNKARILK